LQDLNNRPFQKNKTETRRSQFDRSLNTEFVTPSQAFSNPTDDIIGEDNFLKLMKLKELKDKGAITNIEYQKKKMEIIAKI
jgi:hypothetical protein